VPGLALIANQTAQDAGKQQFLEYDIQLHDTLADASFSPALPFLSLL
jgi:DNA-binding FadR family transcriptional regulator